MIKSKPMIKLSESIKTWTLSTQGGIELKQAENESYRSNEGLLVLEQSKACGAISQVQYTVKNVSEHTVRMDHVSSGCFDRIGGGLLPWHDERKFKLHMAYFTWQGEAQWREVSLSDMGLYRASNHNDVNAIRIRSVGNQSTAICAPQIFIEDTEMNQTYVFGIEATGNWYIEIGGNQDGTLCVELNSAFFNHDNWCLNLESGHEYTASPCFYGKVCGGFEEAVRALTDYRRKTSKANWDVIPVCFNDYMNCLWGRPETHKLIPLIDKAAEVGCEVFCIDAGWQKTLNADEGVLGDWEWQDERFPQYGFQGIIEYIKNKGMLPGVWLELNSVTENSTAYQKLSDCILKRNGVYSVASDRVQVDFRKEAVIKHMTEVMDRLYAAGVRYIKNDYNQTCGIGFDGEQSVGEEERQNSLAFDRFIDMICAKYPDLVIENCASGSMRTDDSIMRHFHLVSVSDQEFYYNNPSILSGIEACVQPEKCGSWAYPYPQMYEDRKKSAVDCVKTDNCASETIFNMVNGMLGLMYLSGHIELADEENTALIRESIDVYKENRAFIASAYPIYPSGRIRMDKTGFYSYGLISESRDKILLGVWRIRSAENVQVFDLSKYICGDVSVKPVYPQSIDTKFSYANGKLSVQLDDAYGARLFEITKQA